MNNIDLEKCKKTFEDIKIPDNLNISIEEGKRKALKNRRIKSKMPIAGAVAVFLTFIILINTSVTVAEAVDNIPVLKNVAEMLRINEGIKFAMEEGYIQEVNKVIEKDGVKITITRVIGDCTKLIIGYTIEGGELNEETNKGYAGINITTTEKDKFLSGYISYGGTQNYSSDGLEPLPGEKYITTGNMDMNDIPKEILINFKGIQKKNYVNGIAAELVNVGDFSIPVELKEQIIKVMPEIRTINKSINLGDHNLLIKEMRIYPMSTEVIVDSKVGNNDIFGWLDNCYLQDEKGRAFALTSGESSKETGEYTLSFNGGAYGKAKELTLITEGMYYDPLEGRELVVDLKNKKLLEGDQYGIKLASIDKYMLYQEEPGVNSYLEALNEDIEKVQLKDEKQIQYQGIEIRFKAADSSIKSINLSHEKYKRSSSANLEGEYLAEASIYFDEVDLKEDTISINLNLLQGENNKTEGFSFKLK